MFLILVKGISAYFCALAGQNIFRLPWSHSRPFSFAPAILLPGLYWTGGWLYVAQTGGTSGKSQSNQRSGATRQTARDAKYDDYC